MTRAAAEGDPGAPAVMASFAWWLALGLANLANIFDPATIVIGGGLVDAGRILLEPVRQAFAEPGRGVRATVRRSTSSPPGWANRPVRSAPPSSPARRRAEPEPA